MAQTETVKIEGTPEQLAAALGQLSNKKRYRIVEVEESEGSSATESALPDPQNAASIALLKSWLEEDATDDPEERRAAEEELLEFKRNMNKPRKEAGARLLYPEAE